MAPAFERRVASLRRLARRLDSSIRVPGGGVRIGLDPIIGLVPGLGHLVSPLLTAAILWQARAWGIPRIVQMRRLANAAMDAILGTVPLAGDLFDAGWKANDRDVALIERHSRGQGPSARGDGLFVALLTLALAAAAIVPLLLTAWLLGMLRRGGSA